MSDLLPSQRLLRLLDWGIAVWAAGWIAMGVTIGISVGNLTALNRTVISDGDAVQSIGRSLQVLGAVPLVGGTVARDGRRLERAGANAVVGARSGTSSIDELSVLLGIAVALLPSVPALVFYLPLRIERRRERRSLAAAITVHGGEPEFQAFLARRALARLSYRRLRRVAGLPWEGADVGVLARAELERLGIDPRLLRVPDGSDR